MTSLALHPAGAGREVRCFQKGSSEPGTGQGAGPAEAGRLLGMGGTQVLSPDSRAAESHRGRLGETGPGSESPHTGRCPQSQPGAAKGLGQLCLLPEPGTGSAAVCMCLCVCVWSKVVASNSHCQADQKSQSPPPPALSESLHRFGFPLVQLTPPGRNRKHVWPAPDRPPHPKPPPNIGFRFIKTQAPLVSCPSPHTH